MINFSFLERETIFFSLSINILRFKPIDFFILTLHGLRRYGESIVTILFVYMNNRIESFVASSV